MEKTIQPSQQAINRLQAKDLAGQLVVLDKTLALYTAAQRGDGDALRDLLAEGADPDLSIDGRNRYPLHLAAYAADFDCVSQLLRAGAAPDARMAEGMTALHVLAARGAVELPRNGAQKTMENMLPMFLAAGADIDAKDTRGKSPLHLAAENGRQRDCRLLLEAGADVFSKDAEGRTPADVAVDALEPLLRAHEEHRRLAGCLAEVDAVADRYGTEAWFAL